MLVIDAHHRFDKQLNNKLLLAHDTIILKEKTLFQMKQKKELLRQLKQPTLFTALLFLYVIVFVNSVIGQTNYQQGWDALNNANVDDAVMHFEKALAENETDENTLLCLTFLYSQRNKAKKAAIHFEQYMKTAENPYPALYAMWFENGVLGEDSKKEKHQLELLKSLSKDKNNKLERAVLYKFFRHYTMSNDLKGMQKFSDQLITLNTWGLAGPFDNVMNNGFDKDFGVLKNPKEDATFASKYGAEINWFTPKKKSRDGYLSANEYFYADNAIMYAQTFVKATDTEKEILLKAGYSGSLKIWVNDEVIYAEKKRRRTELDFYTFKLKLNKGYNRILVQLGDYNEQAASFSMRITDLENNPIALEQSATYQPYITGPTQAEAIKHFAVAYFESKNTDENDLLHNILLAKAYERSFELQKAEAIYENILVKHPKNYFALRNLVLLYGKSGNTTNQNKYYSLFEESYPHSLDILSNDIKEALNEKDKAKYKKLTKIFLDKYPGLREEFGFKLGLAGLEEDYKRILSLVDDLYKNFPNDYTALTSKYKLEKNHYSNPEKAKQLLVDYLKENYAFSIVEELGGIYIEEGKFDKAQKLFETSAKHIVGDFFSKRLIVNLLSRQEKYKEGIAICKEMLKNTPSDYRVMQDIARLALFEKDQKTALEYYRKSIEYYPFSFETNEKIRELEGKEKAMDFVPEVDPVALLKAYESKGKPAVKKSFDVVLEKKSTILFKSSAQGMSHSYLIKINDETAIENWQQASFSAKPNFRMNIKEALTVKKNGEKIDAERSGGEVVFTNLEIGDYVFVHYVETQVSGGKTTKFISDTFPLNASVPCHKLDYNLYVEEGLAIKETISLGNLKPTKETKQGFVHYNWTKENPKVLKEEKYAVPFNDLAEMVHFSVNHSWDEIVQWYSDLSAHQARPDYTIEKIAKDLFEGKSLSVDEKFHAIYDFVCKNIQYSYIDFRQSGYIPQKASNIYHSRLGDCKDVSTLFVSIARSIGLKANLVLINTSDNGQKSVVLPSLNFNHCIVKAYDGTKTKYLELTDPNLPYGYLYSYHKNAPILEIPYEDEQHKSQLEYLDFNKGYENTVSRVTMVEVQDDNVMKIKSDNVKRGTLAGHSCSTYFNVDETERRDILKNALSPKFQSGISIDEFTFSSLAPLEDFTEYSYSYTVANEILKLGSMKSLKIPFSDVIIRMSLFEDGEREFDFDYIYYEHIENYEETLNINLGANRALVEVPENVHLEYNKNIYDLKFEKTAANQLKVHRSYRVNRENIKAEDFKDFRAFMTKVNEAEHTHLLYK